MSISFNQSLNSDQQKILASLMGAPIVHDGKEFLYDSGNKQINKRDMKKLANEVKQPVTINLHSVGDKKTLSDGTEYVVTERGWKKVERKDRDH